MIHLSHIESSSHAHCLQLLSEDEILEARSLSEDIREEDDDRDDSDDTTIELLDNSEVRSYRDDLEFFRNRIFHTVGELTFLNQQHEIQPFGPLFDQDVRCNIFSFHPVFGPKRFDELVVYAPKLLSDQNNDADSHKICTNKTNLIFAWDQDKNLVPAKLLCTEDNAFRLLLTHRISLTDSIGPRAVARCGVNYFRRLSC